jgi:hypothetical protein
MERSPRLALFLLLLAGSAVPAGADTRTILGGSFDVRNSRHGDASGRAVLLYATEQPTSDDVIVGDPTIDGATLRIVARGDSAAYDTTIDLPAAGWKATFTRHDWPVYKGFVFSNRTVGGPVRSLIIRRADYRSPEGTPPPEVPKPGPFRLKLRLVGHDGQIDVLPPNPGTEGGIVLTMIGGDAYCVGFGGVAGGDIVSNSERRLSIVRPTAEACPGD